MKDKTVLLVDDDFHIVKVLSLKLENAEFNVMSASNGREALAKIEETVPDIVITDFSMPFMTGVELVKALREKEETADLPIIMLTARGQTVEDSEGEGSLNISALISKPFSPREMLRQVQSLLGVEVS